MITQAAKKTGVLSHEAVITGMGIICSLGKNRQEVFESVRGAQCGIAEVRAFDLDKLSTQLGGEIAGLSADFPKEVQDRTAQLAYLAMQEAIDDSALDIFKHRASRYALSFGTCNGGILTLETLYKNHLRDYQGRLSSVYQNNYMAIDYLNKKFNIDGVKTVFVTACSASNNAIGYAFDLITTEQADVVFVGGADSLAKTTFAGFNSLQSLAEDSCTPFSEKTGISLGEGAAFMVLESLGHAQKRKARIHARILGYGFCGDAYHATSPDLTGDGAIRTMRAAVESAGINKEDIGFVCAHGTGTEANDKTESFAIKQFFGKHSGRLYITSTKSMHGHALGAAGIIQAVISIDCMNHNLIPAIVNFTKQRECCGLSYVMNKPLQKKIDYFLSNSFAFGGNNVSVVFGKAAHIKKTLSRRISENRKIVVTGMGYCTPRTHEVPLRDLLKVDYAPSSVERIVYYENFVLRNPRFRKFRKAPRISQFAIQAIENALEDTGYKIEDGTKIGMIWGVAKGPLKIFEKYYRGILSEGLEFASALYFPHIVSNSVAGQASIAFGIKGCNTTMAGQFSPFAALQYAMQLIRQGKNEIFIVGGADEISQFDEEMMKKEGINNYLSEGSAALIIESEEHARKRGARIYAEIDGFSMASSYYDKNVVESYKKCVTRSLRKAKLAETDIDLHVPCQFGGSSQACGEAIDVKMTANSQHMLGTLESATAILNTIVGLEALTCGFVPRDDARERVERKGFRNILVSGVSYNGTYYSFILKRPEAG